MERKEKVIVKNHLLIFLTGIKSRVNFILPIHLLNGNCRLLIISCSQLTFVDICRILIPVYLINKK